MSEQSTDPLEAVMAAAFGPAAHGERTAGERTAGERTAGERTGVSEGPGAVIGPYKLMEQIGEGGMGLVFVAEQLQPVRRKVAVKVLKPGMDSRAVVARFEAERQALALMDHPHIARVLDGGRRRLGGPTSQWSWSAACPSRTTAIRTA
jgi:serine/threonine protein kinase